MKIGILTLALGNNYGGLLQAYALQTILKAEGHHPIVLIRKSKNLKLDIMRSVRNCIFRVMNKFYVTDRDKKELSKNMIYFSNHYITPQSPIIKSSKGLRKYVLNNSLDALVVGSDQVWRPSYSPCITNFYFDFANDIKIKKISYAASFGVDTWEYSSEDTEKCKKLIQEFNAISVRENSGIELCKNHLNSEAKLVLDPTLLLNKEDYESLITREQEQQINGDLFCYVLDKSPVKSQIVDNISVALKYNPYFCMPEKIAYSEMTRSNKAEFLYPPVTRWLRSFKDAKMVVTDSFHGCVFSIIFNKPFWVIGNSNRGLSRFKSLLCLFNLENRLIDINRISDYTWNAPIDWENVNSIKEKLRKDSMSFIKEHLK